jgi:hypothetical protein
MNRVKKRIKLRLGRKRLNRARKIGRLLLLIGVLPSLCLSANANVGRLALLAAKNGDEKKELFERAKGLNTKVRLLNQQQHNSFTYKPHFEPQTLDFATVRLLSVALLSCRQKETASVLQ